MLILLIVFCVFMVLVVTVALIIFFSYRKTHYKSEVHISGGANIETGRLSSDDNYFKGISGKAEETVLLENTYSKGFKKGLNVRIVNLKNSASTSFNLTDCIIIGRVGGNHNCNLYDDLTVSKIHCKIYAASGKVYISDCHSVNHTFLNGKMIMSLTECKSGDIIKVGKTELRILF